MLMCLPGLLFAQKLELGALGMKKSLPLLTQEASADWENVSLSRVPADVPAGLALSQNVLPNFARENPSGYSFLCRTELKWEQRMPLAVWFRSETTGEASAKGILPSTYLRLRRPF